MLEMKHAFSRQFRLLLTTLKEHPLLYITALMLKRKQPTVNRGYVRQFRCFIYIQNNSADCVTDVKQILRKYKEEDNDKRVFIDASE